MKSSAESGSAAHCIGICEKFDQNVVGGLSSG